MRVANTGDRPIQVGSHTHFFEVNDALRFDREQAYGRRLDVPAGTSLRFEPGEARDVTLIPLAGRRDRLRHERAASTVRWRHDSMKIRRDAYANLYGPTTGDRVRLGDTDLFLEIERDFAHLRRRSRRSAAAR